MKHIYIVHHIENSYAHYEHIRLCQFEYLANELKNFRNSENNLIFLENARNESFMMMSLDRKKTGLPISLQLSA